MVELILTGATVACVIGLAVFAHVQKRDPDTVWELTVIAIGIAILIWAPAWVRSTIVGSFAVIAVWQLGGGYVIAMLALVVAIAIWLPGGVSAVMFGILAVVGFRQVRETRQHLIRIARASQLLVHELADHEVELTGTAHAVWPTVDPVFGGGCALWEVTTEETSQRSRSLVEIRGAEGAALVEPMEVAIQWTNPAKRITGDEAARAASVLGLAVSDKGLTMSVLPEGTECYVVGIPTWTTSPNAGTYRDGPTLPIFQSRGYGMPVLADRSEASLRSEFRWALVSWATWGALCGAIAVLQVGGWS